MKPDYTIKIWYPHGPMEDKLQATVTNCRYNDSKDFFAKTEKALMKQIAEWMETH